MGQMPRARGSETVRPQDSELSQPIVRLLGPDEGGQRRAISWWIGDDIHHQISSHTRELPREQISGTIGDHDRKGFPGFRGPIGLSGFGQYTSEIGGNGNAGKSRLHTLWQTLIIQNS